MQSLAEKLIAADSAKGEKGVSSKIAHYYSTRCRPLDIQLGGGVPSGRIVEIYGNPSEGKSTIALEFVKAFQNYWAGSKTGGVVLWIESESVFDKLRAAYVGCSLKTIMIREVGIVEDGFEMIKAKIKQMASAGAPLLIVWDTIAATMTSVEKSSGAYAGGISHKPRVVKHYLNDIVSLLGETDTTLVLVNQVYRKVNSPGGGSTSPGGMGIKFFSSVRMKVQCKERIFADDSNKPEQMVALVSELFTVKNKITLPRRKVLAYIETEKGFNGFETTYLFCLKNGIFSVKGGWKYFEFEGHDLKFQNPAGFRKLMKQHPGLYDYVNYRVTLYFASVSPFSRVKLIKELWDYEMPNFGEKQTELSNDELNLAKEVYSKKELDV